MTKPGLPLAFLRDAVASDADPCIEWPFARNGKGYGCIQHEGAVRLVTHVALSLSGHDRPTPESMALHSCDNPPCCNPRHLRWGTGRENMGDALERDRLARGVQHPNAKLTPAAVVEIRRLAADGESRKDIARRFGVTHEGVRSVLEGKTWSHVPARVAS